MSKAQSGAVPVVSLLFGRKAREDLFDEYLAGEHMERITSMVAPDGAVTVSRYDAAEASVADCLDEVATPSLWGGVRLVIIDNAEKLLSPSVTERDALQGLVARMASFASATPHSAFLVLIARALDVRADAPVTSFAPAAALIKAISAAGGLFSCVPPYESTLKSALLERARRAGVRIIPAAVDALIAMTGTDQLALQSELDKLIITSDPSRPVNAADVEALVASRAQASVFSLADHILDTNIAAAAADLRSLRETPATRSAAFLLMSLSASFRRYLAAAEDVDAGKTPAAAAAASGMPRFFQRAFAARLSRWTSRDLVALLDRVLVCDMQVKTASVSEEIALETFIADACARRLESPQLVGRWIYEI